MPTADEYAAHARELARAFGVPMHERPGMAPDQAGAGVDPFTGKMFIAVSPIVDETTYIVALHELGHCIDPMGHLHEHKSKQYQLTRHPANLRDVRLLMDEEIAAWKWARRHALEWTPAMKRVREMTFGSYRRLARSLGHNL